jgi:hypothetical protein
MMPGSNPMDLLQMQQMQQMQQMFQNMQPKWVCSDGFVQIYYIYMSCWWWGGGWVFFMGLAFFMGLYKNYIKIRVIIFSRAPWRVSLFVRLKAALWAWPLPKTKTFPSTYLSTPHVISISPGRIEVFYIPPAGSWTLFGDDSGQRTW